MRVEDPEVFEETHALIARLAKRRRHRRRARRPSRRPGRSAQYLERLAELFAAAAGWWWRRSSPTTRRCPADWPAHGTTGYRFANLLTGVFVDAAAESRFDRVYRRFTGERRSFDEIARREPHR